MKIYLAGGVTGNLNLFWKKYMEIYLAGTYSRDYVVKEAMNIYLAGNLKHCQSWFGNDLPKALYILESYYYILKQDWILPLIPHFKGFLLDSGAFSFMGDIKSEISWDQYVENYAEFINKNNIDLFLELDIDSIVGLKEVERLRDKLEILTNKQCIPVFHKSRGKNYWIEMVKNYKYVSIGGIVKNEISRSEYHYFNWFLESAKEYGCKVHGLGFTNLDGLIKYHFYSVDSTAWLYGNRGGFLYMFSGKSIDKINAPKDMRLNSRQAAIHNFNEWVKFQKYAEDNL